MSSPYASECTGRSNAGHRCRNVVVTVDPMRGGLCKKHAKATAEWIVNEREAARLIWAMQQTGLLAAATGSQS